MRNIIVVDCLSTGINYIADIVNRGYNPIVLQLKSAGGDEESYEKELSHFYEMIDEKFDMIFEKDSYEETLEKVKKYDPELIVAGSERGVILTTKLSHDLGLLGNPIEDIDAMTLKDKMQEKIAEAGLRYIRGKSVNSLEEAIEYYDSESFSEVVVKPVYSGGSTGVHLCSNRDEMIDAVNLILSEKNFYGQDIDTFVIQERIKGEEYVVNTASCNGIHMVTLMWKYSKVETNDGAMIYDTMETVNELNIGEAQIVEYAYKVADALEIKYGPVHGEYMVDENGPVLIEVNCRPSGASMPAEFLDRIAGYHETDIFLDSYLKPKRFLERRKKKYRLNAYGALKMFIVPKDIIARSAPINNISPKLKSFYKSNLVDIDDTEIFYVKTHDLATSCGYIYMVHKDNAVVKSDVDFLRMVEKNSFSLVLSDKQTGSFSIDEDEIRSQLKSIVDVTDDYGTGLLITDQFLDDVDVVQVGIDELDTINGEFDYVIVNLNRSLIDKKDDITSQIILDIFSDIRVGGMVFIPETTYKNLSIGRNGIESLIKSLGLRIELPPYGIDTGIIASKENF